MPTATKPTSTITRADVEAFDKVRSQMKQLSADIETLSKKAPDNPVSKFKLNFINEKLRDANQFLAPPFQPISGFEQFDDSTLPSNSDVLIVLTQYLACLEQWRSAQVHREHDGLSARWVWNVTGETIGTEAPTSASHREDDDASPNIFGGDA
jgi:hypothetical protein